MKELNSKQIEAVGSIDGHVLILAGAGTGKTRVLIARIIKILESNLSTSNNILAVTFTNKAANEIKLRLQEEGIELQWLSTFHSICLKIIRYNSEKLGLKNSFSILDSDDQSRLVTKMFKEAKIDTRKYSVKSMIYNIRKWKDRNVRPEELNTSMEKFEVIKFYKNYQEKLKSLNTIDFAGLITKCIELFNLYPPVLDYYQSLFKYILVDEYQDINSAQYTWLKMISKKNQNLCCVGDDDQSIYGWRGAEVGNILKFEQDFNNAKIIRLEQNYRSKGNILKAASSLIANNENRLGKELWTKDDMGDKVLIQETKNDSKESKYIADKINDLNNKYILNDMAILVRAGFQTRSFEERLLSMGIAYKIIGGIRFYERQEIKDIIAYCKLLLEPEDEMSFERIVNVPKRGIGEASIQAFFKTAKEEKISIVKAAQASTSLKSYSKLKDFFFKVEKFRNLLEKENEHQKIIEDMLSEFGYFDYLKKDDDLKSQAKIENVKEFLKAIGEFGSIQTLLEHVHLILENSLDSKNAVNIMTIHSAKGLEFPIVFLPGFEEGLFPSGKSISEKGKEGLEEERRLAYVALSRAKTKAIVTYTAQRRQRNFYTTSTPSRFIDEISKEYVVHNRLSPVISDSFQKGDIVSHKYFGIGTVVGVNCNKTIVDFEKVGEKRIFKEFLEKKK